jgi:hypothetical protein
MCSESTCRLLIRVCVRPVLADFVAEVGEFGPSPVTTFF